MGVMLPRTGIYRQARPCLSPSWLIDGLVCGKSPVSDVARLTAFLAIPGIAGALITEGLLFLCMR